MSDVQPSANRDYGVPLVKRLRAFAQYIDSPVARVQFLALLDEMERFNAKHIKS